MTDAKHEAPAETITSAELIANTDYARGAVRVQGETEDRRIYGQPEAPAEGAGERLLKPAGSKPTRCYCPPDRCDAPVIMGRQTPCIRARSSAPEALGNLLAVIHRDGGQRTLVVGVEQAAAEAEKIVANLLSSAPEAREGEAVGHFQHSATWNAWEEVSPEYAGSDGVIPLYTHPAALSADKLRIAVEALERIKLGDVEVLDDELGVMVEVSASADELSEIADQALAALKAEGA